MTTRAIEVDTEVRATPAARSAGASNERNGLEALFRPRSIAVVGASRRRGTIGAEIFHNLIEHEFQGVVHPINPSASAVQAVRAYSTVDELREPVDLAIIVVPAKQVEGVLEACGRKGVRAAVVISAGFKEVGGAGIERERRLIEIARRHGMRLVGPNCLGVLNTEASVRMNATFAPVHPPAGSVAFSSQSGALGLAILDVATRLGIGISQFASVGNKADVSGNDLLEFWEHDPGTRIVLLYLESFGNPARFMEIARRVGRVKPIVAVKSGRTRAGIRAAASHTGSLAGADTAVSALCAQSGVIRTDTMEELFDVAMLLAHQPVPRGNRVGIVTNAGGPGIMASDACESHGLEVITLADETVRALEAFLPAEASTRNPVDMIASATPESFERAVRLVANDPNVDSVLALYVPPVVTRPLEVAQAIVRGCEAAKTDARARAAEPKPVLTCFMGSHGVHQGLRSLHQGHVPSYAFPESAAIALAHAVRYGRWRDAPAGTVPELGDVDRVAAARVIAAALAEHGGRETAWLDPYETKALLSAYRIETLNLAFATGADEAVEAAERMGYPVAIKLVSPTLTHKSDVGGVVLDVRDGAEVRWAVHQIEERLARLGKRDEMKGVLIQPMASRGVETVVGMTRDESFGPLLMFGLGGVHVELLRDVVFRVHPLTDRDASEMVRGIRGAPLLEGHRGAAPSDVRALEETILRVSRLVGDHPEIVEMDLNPLSVREAGKGCVVLDARVQVRRSARPRRDLEPGAR
jgi:acetyltransferase